MDTLPALSPRTGFLTTILWTGALVVAALPWFGVLFWQLGLGAGSLDPLFVFAVGTAIAALFLSGLGLYLLLRARGDVLVFAVSFGSLALNAVAVGLGARTWFTTFSCGPGSVGPCMTPFVLCGLGFFAVVIAAVFAGVGLFAMGRSLRLAMRPEG